MKRLIFANRNLKEIMRDPLSWIFCLGFPLVMLFAALLISGNRQQAFLLRIFTSPMRSSDYIVGYIIQLIVLSAGQSVITGIAGLIMGLTSDDKLNFLNILVSVILSLFRQ